MMYFELQIYNPNRGRRLIVGRFDNVLDAEACTRVIAVAYDKWFKTLDERRASLYESRRVYLDFVVNIFPLISVDNLDSIFKHQALINNKSLIGQMSVVPVQVIEHIDSSRKEDLNYLLREYDRLEAAF